MKKVKHMVRKIAALSLSLLGLVIFTSMTIQAQDFNVTLQWFKFGELNQPLAKDVDNGIASVECAIFNRQNNTIVTGSKRDGRVRKWDMNGNLLWDRAYGTEVECLAFSSDGSKIFAGGEAANIKVYRASDGVVLATITTGIISSVDGMSLSPNGSILAAGDEGGKIHLYNASTHAWIRTIVHGADEQAGGPAGVHADINSLSWTSDSVYLATASRQGNVKVWRASDGTWVRTYTGHTGSVKATRISPNKAWLASAGFDNQVIFYNLATGAVLKKFALGWMGETVEWTPDSHNLFVGGQGTGIKVYRTLTSGFTEVQTIPCFRQEYIHFTTTMGNLLTAHEDGTVRKWALTKRY